MHFAPARFAPGLLSMAAIGAAAWLLAEMEERALGQPLIDSSPGEGAN